MVQEEAIASWLERIEAQKAVVSEREERITGLDTLNERLLKDNQELYQKQDEYKLMLKELKLVVEASDAEQARLKAEVERLQSANRTQAEEYKQQIEDKEVFIEDLNEKFL